MAHVRATVHTRAPGAFWPSNLSQRIVLELVDAAALVLDGECRSRFPIQEIDFEIVLAALATKYRYQVSYWDAAIIEAARAAGCDVVLSEDLNRGRDYGGVRAINPFRTDGN